MGIDIEFSLKDLRIVLKHADNSISILEKSVKSYASRSGLNLQVLVKRQKEELETMYAYRIHLYTEIGKLK